METLVPVQSIVSSGHSLTLSRKISQAERLLREKAATFGMQDPVIVTPKSNELIVNLLFHYSGLSSDDEEGESVKTRDTLNNMITALRWVYRNHNHVGSWSIRTEGGKQIAFGNPLENNYVIADFRRTHAKKLASIGKVVRTALPIPAQLVIDHANKYFFVENLDVRDVHLHVYLLASMSLGLRYDEYAKFFMSELEHTRSCTQLDIGQICKNGGNTYRNYCLRRWPGEQFSNSIIMDPIFAFSMWLHVRGNVEGYVFCQVVGEGSNAKIVHHTPYSRKTLLNFLQSRSMTLGYGVRRAKRFTGHSAKRGGVQLMRFLGCTDLYIMNWFKMSGQKAYIRYTEGFNDLSGLNVPAFHSTEALQSHARAASKIEEIMEEVHLSDVEDWLNTS